MKWSGWYHKGNFLYVIFAEGARQPWTDLMDRHLFGCWTCVKQRLECVVNKEVEKLCFGLRSKVLIGSYKVSKLVKMMSEKKPKTFQESCCRNSSEASKRSTHLLNHLKNHRNRILIFTNKKTFTVGSVFNKQKDQLISFGSDVSEHHWVSTTNHSASITMVGVSASHGEKTTPVWLKRGYMLISAVY